jgi:hypothetical protein
MLSAMDGRKIRVFHRHLPLFQLMATTLVLAGGVKSVKSPVIL